MIHITFSTGNPNKIKEVQERLSELRAQSEFADLPPIELHIPAQAGDIEETGTTFMANAQIKAQGVTPAPGSHYIMAEDSGVVIPALDHTYEISPFPGIFSNRWLTPEREAQLWKDLTPPEGDLNQRRNQTILHLMDGQTNRQGFYHCAMVLYPVSAQSTTASEPCFQTECTLPLQVTTQSIRGEGGFGYDPIMEVDEDSGVEEALIGHTVAQLTPEVKNKVSHRGKALQALIRYLHHTTASAPAPSQTPHNNASQVRS